MTDTPPALLVRLNRFQEQWISNPAARLEFIRLVDELLNHPREDHADDYLYAWLQLSKEALKRIGIR